MLSILAHLLFGLGAAYFIVQQIQAKRKITFQGGPPSPNPSSRALEHKVNMTRKRQTMSAPMQAKRITTTGLSKISLPDMPTLPGATEIIPGKMAGMGGAGIGGFGMGGGMGSGAGLGSGGLVPLFGMKRAAGGSLAGTFYDLKQDRNGKPTNMAIVDQQWDSPAEAPANNSYYEVLADYCKNGWSDGRLQKYFKSPAPLYATQIFIPSIPADDGPKEFGLADKVQPRRWIVHYKAKVTPPESGRFRFVGFGDDVLVVKFNGRNVLDAGYLNPTHKAPDEWYVFDGLQPDINTPYRGCGIGDFFEVTGGNSYNIDVLIGECPGGRGKAWLLLEKEGGTYDKDSKGNPILPIFKVAPGEPTSQSGEAPVYAKQPPAWSVWKAEKAASDSLFFGSSL